MRIKKRTKDSSARLRMKEHGSEDQKKDIKVHKEKSVKGNKDAKTEQWDGYK